MWNRNLYLFGTPEPLEGPEHLLGEGCLLSFPLCFGPGDGQEEGGRPVRGLHASLPLWEVIVRVRELEDSTQ